MAVTGGRDSKDFEPAWHQRTSTVLGASAAALVVLAILFFGVSCVSRAYTDPPPASQYFVDPSTLGSRSSTSGATTTTQTITSTSPALTTDINPGDPTTTSDTDTSTSDSSSTTTTTTTTTQRSTSTNDRYPPPTRRPRYNETRTPYPLP